jgi:hypothetical protein
MLGQQIRAERSRGAPGSKHDHSDDGGTHKADACVSIDRDVIHCHCSVLSDYFVLIPLDIHVALRSSTWALHFLLMDK